MQSRTLDDQIAQTMYAARDALVQEWSTIRWHWWCVVRWRGQVSDMTANDHLERLIRDLHRTASPTIRVVAGFHDDPGHPHAHVLVHLSRRTRARFLNATEFHDWFAQYWYHGKVLVEVFDETRRDPVASGGAIAYLARNPGTVVWG